MSVSILIGDMRERLKELPDASVDSCVCDPPYHLTSIVKRFGAENAAPAQSKQTGVYARSSRGFMGQTWDGGDVAFDPDTWAEVLRVLKPGGHLVAFSGCRTYHRMTSAIEDAGFEIREMLSWNFGSGFPKSLNVFKQLEASGLACLCGKSKLSHHYATAENVRRLQQAVDAQDALSSGAQSDLREDVRGPSDRHETGGAPAEGSAIDSVRDVRNDGSPPAVTSGAGESGLLQRVVPLKDVRGAAASVRREHEGQETGTAIRPEESRVEGRRLPETDARELSGREVSESAGMGAADGAQGRLHNAAPASDGADVRLPADANGSGKPQGSQPGEQSSVEPGTVADECGPQAWGGWPVCGGCRKPIIPEGLGTALKPAHEPICLARKPLIGTVAQNVLSHGVGALNIDGCRIETTDADASQIRTMRRSKRETGDGWGMSTVNGDSPQVVHPEGRWPANLLHDGSDEVLAGFPDSDSTPFRANGGQPALHGGGIKDRSAGGFDDSGSAARFFYCAKATTEERGEGNNHPTVKPVALMRWLCRLVTPKGGTVLDPFMGSGSTGLACDAEQFDFIGCELSPEYAAIAEQRIRAAAGMFADVKVAA